MLPIKIQANFSYQEYLRLSYSLLFRRKSAVAVFVLAILLIILTIIAPPESASRSFWYISLALFMLVEMPAIVYFSAKRSYTSNARLAEPRTYEFSEKQISVFGQSFSSHVDWSKLFKIVETKDWILLYESHLSAHMITKMAFGSDWAEFRRLLDQIPNVKKQLRKI